MKAILKLLNTKNLFATDKILVSSMSSTQGVIDTESNSSSERMLVAFDKAELKTEVPGQPLRNLHGGKVL